MHSELLAPDHIMCAREFCGVLGIGGVGEAIVYLHLWAMDPKFRHTIHRWLGTAEGVPGECAMQFLPGGRCGVETPKGIVYFESSRGEVMIDCPEDNQI